MNPIHSTLYRHISYSSLEDFLTCERMYQLRKLNTGSKEATIDTAFGKSVAAGVQSLFLTGGDLDRAIGEAFFAWDIEFSESKESSKKSIAHAIHAVRLFFPFFQILSQDWHLLILDGKPGIEYALKIEFPDGFIYRSYTDLLLEHNETNEIAVVELKTTADSNQDEAKYKNSNQGTSYALLIDQLRPEASHFWVKYLAYYSRSMEWVPYDFPKALIDKARWLRTTLLDIGRIKRAEEEEYFPMRGGSCMQFGRRCRFFDLCQLPDKALVASDVLLAEKVKAEEETPYSFVVPIEKIVEGYLS